MADIVDPNPLLALTAQIVSAHVGHNSVPSTGMTALIREVYSTLRGLGTEPEAAAPEQREPAVPVKRSVFPDYIVCLEDGKKLKMLKRHLQSAYGMTTDQYREKWGLPATYPMVAPNYAEHRSALAKKIGLGRKRSVEGASAPTEEPKRRGRKPGRPAAAAAD